jgi:lysyl-tRNA synthetase class 2
MSTLNELRNIRLEKLKNLEKLGLDPYPAQAQRSHSSEEIKADFEKLENKEVSAVGRIGSIRIHSNVVFIDLKDESGKIQLYIKEDHIKEPDHKKNELGFSHIELLDVGDFIQAEGSVVKTKTGQISIQVTTLKMVSKSIRPLPNTWEGLKDIEERYRKRYLDFLVTPEAKAVIDARWKVEQEIRRFLWDNKFVEVETPILQPLYGGTNAKPFTTHFNALDCEFYLRVAPELYLKRLVVGGYERVFEIARNFRNEGIDHSHFPEFTMLEWYEAFADYQLTMDRAEALAKHLAKTVKGSTKLIIKGEEIEIGEKWERISIQELLKRELNVDWDESSEAEVKSLQTQHGVTIRGVWTKNKALFALFDKLITPKLKNPTWVIDYPIDVSPLSRQHRSKKGLAERFEGYVGGMEIFDGWSEIVSGLEQRRRFETEQKNMKEGDTEAMPLDEDFIEALEYGCPPMGGIGFGIDRLVMFITDTWAIKDVVAFPTLKPKGDQQDD